jgi:hypothetical protein
MVGLAEAPTTARTGLAGWVSHNQSVVKLVGAAFVGLVILPIIFPALGRFDVNLGGRISVVDLIWLVLAAVAGFAMLQARGTLSIMAGSAASRLLAMVPGTSNAGTGAAAVSPSVLTPTHDLAERGGAIARGLLDLVLLLLIQATLRPPLVGLLSGTGTPALVDGAYVVVVVALALVILFRLYRSVHPLAEQLTWLALNQIVPTAGFAASSVSATFATRLATATSRPATVTAPTPPPAEVAAAVSAEGSAPTIAAEPTIAAADLQSTLPAEQPTILAAPPNHPPVESTEATVPQLVSERPPAEPDATVVSAEADDGSTVVFNPRPADEPRATDQKDESR